MLPDFIDDPLMRNSTSDVVGSIGDAWQTDCPHGGRSSARLER